MIYIAPTSISYDIGLVVALLDQSIRKLVKCFQ